MADSLNSEQGYEEKHVHQVYNEIAPHFSATRFKPWPVVENFLRQLPPGSCGLDIGCGNGKYLTVNKNVFIVASDRSSALVDIASLRQPHDAMVADSLNLPYPDSKFDFAISIAVIHHFSSAVRRIEAIRRMLSTLKPTANTSSPSQALIFVWALEQKNSRRGWDAGDAQDVLVPWVLKPQEGQQASEPPNQTFQRYYHLYRSGELEQDVATAGGIVVKAGYDRDNWWVVAEPGKT